MADEQFIIFRLGDQDYGIPIAAVSEIARPPDHITRLPKAPAFIDGVMNLRGSVVPIVDLRRRFDLSTTEHAGSQRILMVAIGARHRGFPRRQRIRNHESADRCHLAGARIVAGPDAPDLPGHQSGSQIQNGRMVLLVDPAQLLDQVEADVLAKFKPSELDVPVTVP